MLIRFVRCAGNVLRAGLMAGALLLAPAIAHAESPVEIGEGKALPEISFETMDGTPGSLADYQGRVVVLNLWATWCAPCREEMPYLQALQAEFDPAEAIVIGLSVDRASPERVQRFLDEAGVDGITIVRDPKAKASRTLGIPGLPATLVIDQSGAEVARVLGIADWAAPEVVAAIEGMIASN